MSGMDGYEATREIRRKQSGTRTREQLKNSSFPIFPSAMIALIASTLEDEQTTALSVGCDDLIGKPSFPKEDIFEATNNYIEVLYV